MSSVMGKTKARVVRRMREDDAYATWLETAPKSRKEGEAYKTWLYGLTPKGLEGAHKRKIQSLHGKL